MSNHIESFRTKYGYAGSTKNKLRYDALDRKACHGAHVVYVDKELFEDSAYPQEIHAEYTFVDNPTQRTS